MSGGRVVTGLPSTVVRLTSDTGLTGWGEVCPLGPAYLPAYARGARTGIAELAPQLLGADPLALGELNERSEEHTSELQSRSDLVCRLLLEKKKKQPH